MLVAQFSIFPQVISSNSSQKDKEENEHEICGIRCRSNNTICINLRNIQCNKDWEKYWDYYVQSCAESIRVVETINQCGRIGVIKHFGYYGFNRCMFLNRNMIMEILS